MAYTRADLFTEVLSDLNREDKVDKLPGWLLSGESRINNGLRDERMVKRALLEVTDRTFAAPPNFIAQKSATLRHHLTDPVRPGEGIRALKYMPTDQADDGWGAPVPGDDPRGPLWYTMHGNTFELTQWNLTGNYQVDLWYYAKLPKLTDPTSTNWLLDEAPHIYKDAMLHFGFRHLQEFDNADRCLMSMTAELEFYNLRNEEKKYSGPLIQRPVRGFGASSNIRRHR